MPYAPRIPEIGQRDRFVRRVVAERRLFAIRGEPIDLMMPSRRYQARQVALFWSSEKQAQLWAKVLTEDGAVDEISLSEFLALHIPDLEANRYLIGVDWTAEPIEAEVAPDELAHRLKLEALSSLVTAFAAQGDIWSLEDDAGPVLLPSPLKPGRMTLPAAVDKASADRQALRLKGVPRVVVDPLDDFLSAVVPWLTSKGYLLALEPVAEGGYLDIEPVEFARRFQGVAIARPKAVNSGETR